MNQAGWQETRDRGLAALRESVLQADDWLHTRLVVDRIDLMPVQLIDIAPELPGTSWKTNSRQAGWQLAPQGGAFPSGRWRLCVAGSGVSTRWQPSITLQQGGQPDRVEALSPEASADGIWLDVSGLKSLILSPAGEPGRVRWDGAWLERPGLLTRPLLLARDGVATPHSRALDLWPLEGVATELDGRAWRQTGPTARFRLAPRRRDVDAPAAWPQGRGQLECAIHAPGGARLSLMFIADGAPPPVEAISGRPLVADWPAHLHDVILSVDAPDGVFSLDRLQWKPQPAPVAPAAKPAASGGGRLMAIAGPQRDLLLDRLGRIFTRPPATAQPTEPTTAPQVSGEPVFADSRPPAALQAEAPLSPEPPPEPPTPAPPAPEPRAAAPASPEPTPAELVEPEAIPAVSTAAISARLAHLAQSRAEIALRAAAPMRAPDKRPIHPAGRPDRFTAIADETRTPCLTVLLAGCGGRNDHPLWPILARMADGFTLRLAILPDPDVTDPAAALGARHPGLNGLITQSELVTLSPDRPLRCHPSDLFIASEPALAPLAHALTTHATERRQILAFQAEGPLGPAPALLLARARTLPVVWIGLDPFAGLRAEPPHATLATPWPHASSLAAGTVIRANSADEVSWLAALAEECGLPPVDLDAQQPAAVLIDARGPLSGAVEWLPVLAAGGRVITIEAGGPDLPMPLPGWPAVLRSSARPDALAAVLSSLPAPPAQPARPPDWPEHWGQALDERFDGVIDRVLEMAG